MNVSRDSEGDIVLDCQDHSISFSWNRQITPEDKHEENRNKMINDVMNTAQKCPIGFENPNTPRNRASSSSIKIDGMD